MVAAVAYIHATGSAAATQVLYFASKGLLNALPLGWWWFAERRQTPQSGRRRPLGQDVCWGLASGTIIGLAIWAAYAGFFRGLIDRTVLSAQVRAFGAADHYVVYAGFLWLINSGLEEYYWRWFVFGRLRHIAGVPVAVLGSSAAFALHHFVVLDAFLHDRTLAAVLSAGVAAGGVIWAVHYHLSGRVWGVWLSHVIVDLAVLSCGYHLLFGAGRSLS